MHTATAVPSPVTKPELRARALQVRRGYARSLDAELRDALERQLMARVLPHVPFGAVVAGYSPLKDEIDPLPILGALDARGHFTALPWFADRDAVMIFRRAPADEVGPWGVLQPASDASAVQPEIVLVPLVAFDITCNRIGHGKGHYDRALATLRHAGPVRTIGLAWEVQALRAAVPADPWDIPLDAIATPDRWIERTDA